MPTYRDKYQKFFGFLPEGYEVHHVDLNRNNNSLINLVALHKEIHNKYHVSLAAIESHLVKFGAFPVNYSLAVSLEFLYSLSRYIAACEIIQKKEIEKLSIVIEKYSIDSYIKGKL